MASDRPTCLYVCLFVVFFSFLWLPCFAVCWVLRIGPTPREKYTSRMTGVLIPIAFLQFSAGAGLEFAFFLNKNAVAGPYLILGFFLPVDGWSCLSWMFLTRFLKNVCFA